MSQFLSLSLLQWLVLIPVVIGTLYGLIGLVMNLSFWSRRTPLGAPALSEWPPVTILKPVHGLEKDLEQNLRSTCLQDYPVFQVVCSVQRAGDPALPLLQHLQQEFGSERVTVAIEERRAGPNGKINNLLGALAHARHEMLVISDSDVQLRPDYLKTIVAPLADPDVGYVCTLYRAVRAERWFEKLELLTINAEFTPSAVFTAMSGLANFCLGASTAIRRTSLQRIGGLESLADYLVEDYEMGRRLWTSGKRPVIVPYLVDTVVDLKTPRQWWDHQVYWEQNSRAACPGKVFASVLGRPLPFALLFALLRPDILGLVLLATALVIRLGTAGVVMRYCLDDRNDLRSLLLLLPFRDIAALVSWALAFTKRTTIWRGTTFTLTRDGRLVSQEI